MKFNEVLDKWMIDNGYNSSQIEVLTKVDQLRYDASQSKIDTEI